MKRLITAAVLIPLLYLYITKLPEGYFFGLMAMIILLGLYEFYRMFKLNKGLIVLSIFSGLFVFYLSYKSVLSPYSSAPVIEGLTFSFIVMATSRMLFSGDPQGSLRDLSLAISGIVYVVLLASFQLRLRHMGPEWILFFYGVIWLSDSSAYYIGTKFGRAKLAPRLSPNKTVEGAIGSVIGGILGSYILGRLFFEPSKGGLSLPSPASTDLLILGIIIGVGSIIGDLIESMFKRDAGVKDSSNLIPGHGGILDKIDSSLVVAPFVYLYISSL